MLKQGKMWRNNGFTERNGGSKMADIYSAVYDVIYVAKENQSVGGHCLLSYGVKAFTPTPHPPTSNPLSIFCFPLPSLIRVYFFFLIWSPFWKKWLLKN